MGIDTLKIITRLPTRPPIESEQRPPNAARDVQYFVGNIMSVVSTPLDFANLGVANLKLNKWKSRHVLLKSRTLSLISLTRSSSELTCCISKRSQMTSTLVFLQKPCGQQTMACFRRAINPSSRSEIGDLVPGAK